MQMALSQKDYSEHTSSKITTTEWHHNPVTANVNAKPNLPTCTSDLELDFVGEVG